MLKSVCYVDCGLQLSFDMNSLSASLVPVNKDGGHDEEFPSPDIHIWLE